MRTNHPKLSLAGGHAGSTARRATTAATTSLHRRAGRARAATSQSTSRSSAAVRGVPRVDQVGRAARVGRTRQPRQDPLPARRASTPSVGVRQVSRRDQARGEAVPASRVRDVRGLPPRPAQGRVRRPQQGRVRAVPHGRGLRADDVRARPHATTRFKLDGRHAATPCSGCHTGARPRLGFAVPTKQCADCHANPHGTQFDKRDDQERLRHVPHHVRLAPAAHRSLDVAARRRAHADGVCRVPRRAEGGAEPAAYRGIPRDCEGCHDDVHAGQFTATQPVKSCTSCHDPITFRIAAHVQPRQDALSARGQARDGGVREVPPLTDLRERQDGRSLAPRLPECRDCHANPHKEGCPVRRCSRCSRRGRDGVQCDRRATTTPSRAARMATKAGSTSGSAGSAFGRRRRFGPQAAQQARAGSRAGRPIQCRHQPAASPSRAGRCRRRSRRRLRPRPGGPPGLAPAAPPARRRRSRCGRAPRAWRLRRPHGLLRMPYPGGWELGVRRQERVRSRPHGLSATRCTREADCGKCHTAAGKPATNCDGCHEDPHHGRNTARAPSATPRPRGRTRTPSRSTA